MKKIGFTLAEILITLTIVGVVAAITLPTLMSDTTSTQIGPKLAKAVAMFEQANETLLSENSIDTLTDGGYTKVEDETAYGNELSKYLKISKIDYHTETGKSYASHGPNSTSGTAYLAKDGIVYIISTDTVWEKTSSTGYKNIAGNVWIDINGVANPNIMATDVFAFLLMDDGSLVPLGSSMFTEVTATQYHWKTLCNVNETPSDSLFCAGHIFENNLKVLYK